MHIAYFSFTIVFCLHSCCITCRSRCFVLSSFTSFGSPSFVARLLHKHATCIIPRCHHISAACFRRAALETHPSRVCLPIQVSMLLPYCQSSAVGAPLTDEACQAIVQGEGCCTLGAACSCIVQAGSRLQRNKHTA